MAFFLVCALSDLAFGAGEREDLELARRYTDTVHGFSLRPPLGAERKREFSASRLVTWLKRDDKTGAIVWTLSVQRAAETKEQIDIIPYSKALEEKLRKEDNYRIESRRLAPVGGARAIHFRGETGGIRFWQRQVWILRTGGEFLIVSISGPINIKTRLDAICQKVLDTLKLTDPTEAREARRKNLLVGQDFLAALTDARYSAAISETPQWFLLRFNGRAVGFQCIEEAAVRREDANGYEIKTWVMIELPQKQTRLLKRRMFVTGDQHLERSARRLQIGSDKDAKVIDEDVLKQNELIITNILMADGKLRTRKKRVPEKIYLSQATGMLLPRLIDLSKPYSCAFAVYNTERNDFDMRTFTVIGPERIMWNNRKVSAIHAEDQLAVGSEPAQLWLDTTGKLLRMQTEDGLIMVRSTASAVFRRFPRARTFVGQWVNRAQ